MIHPSPLRVIILDDDPDHLQMMQVGLYSNDRGIDVVTTTSGDEALELIRGGGFDCVVSDYLMPDMDGLQFCVKLRKEGFDLPFILFTGQGSEEVAEKAFSVGVDDYLRKENTLAVYTVLAKNIRGLVEKHRAREDLRASEERYRQLVEFAPTGIYELDFNPPRFTAVNDAMSKVMGYPTEELLTMDPLKLLDPESAKSFMDRVRRAQAGEVLQPTVEYKAVKKDGTLIWTQLSLNFRYRDGKIVGVSAVAHDITERRRAEDQIRTTLESIGDGFFSVDSDWRFVYVNKKAESILGIRSADVIGKNHWDVFPMTLGTNLEKEYRRAAAGEERDFENYFEPWDRWFHNRCYPREGGGMSVYLQDITELKKSVQDVARLASFPQLNPSPVIEIDLSGKVHYLNPSASQAFPELQRTGIANVLGYGWFEIIKALAGSNKGFEKDMAHGAMWYSLHFYSAPESDRVRIYAFDITQRKNAEIEKQNLLSSVQSEKDRLSSLVNSMSDEVWFADADKKLILVNPAASDFKLAGSGSDDVEKIASSFEVYRPDGTPRPVEEAPPLRALRGEEVKNQGEIVRIPGKDERRYREVSASPVRGTEGSIIGSVSVVRDMTDHRKVEENLRESEERYRSLFEGMSEGAALHEIVLDDEGKPTDYWFIDVNTAFEKLTGTKKADIIGKRVTEVFPGVERDPANWIGRYGEVALTGKPAYFESYSQQLGRTYSVHAYSPAKNRFAVIFTDITESKKIEEGLREAQRTFFELVERAPFGIYVAPSSASRI